MPGLSATGGRTTAGYAFGLGGAIAGDRARHSRDASLRPVPDLLDKRLERFQSRRASWSNAEDPDRQDDRED
ncbi:MAG: hypothetical protein M3072_10325 [Candidatus Dormibacteraeota bacterium]|nr:hypothetical protein [Candidatus Dormibacteraeota bacterium]